MLTYITTLPDSTSTTPRDVWSDQHVCDYLDNVTDPRVTVTCGIDLFLPPFLFVIGLVSNVLVVLVMRSRSFRSLSTSFYMIVNAITDSTSILFALPVHYIFVNVPHVFAEVREVHAICSFFNVFGWGTSDLGVLYTVAMTTERAIAIKYPLKAYKLCTTRRAKFVVVGLTILEFAKVSHLIFKSRIVSNTRSRLCDIDYSDPAYVSFYANIWPWLHLSILIISYSLVMAGNIIIFINIRRSSKGDTKDGAGKTSIRKNVTSSNKNKQISIMLMIDSFTLVICTSPFAIISIISSQTTINFDLEGGKNLAYTVTFYLLYINRCLNLFLYCVSGSRFRDALKSIFRTSNPPLALEHSSARHDRSLSFSGTPEEKTHDFLGESKHITHRKQVRKSAIFKMPPARALQKAGSLTLKGSTPPAIFVTSSSVMAQPGKFGRDVNGARTLNVDHNVTSTRF